MDARPPTSDCAGPHPEGSPSAGVHGPTPRDGPGLVRTSVFLLLGGFYAVQALSRMAAGGSCQLDEAEQVILSQAWRWGYGSQGPLYTWILLALSPKDAVEIPDLALLKNALLFGTHAMVYLAARRVLRSEPLALLAALLLLFKPHLVYESQRDQTHLVLATFLGAATVHAFLKAWDRGRLRDFAWLGVVSGAAVLSKYNAAFLLAALVLTAWIHRSQGPRRAAGGALLAVVTWLALTAPHWIWAAGNWDLLVSQSAKFQAAASPWDLEPRVRGLARLGLGLASYLALPALLTVLVLRAGRAAREASWTGESRGAPSPQLVTTIMMTCLALVATALVISGASSFKARWLQPLMVLLPIPLIAAWRTHLTPQRVGGFLPLSAATAAVAWAGVQTPIWGAAWLGRGHHINADFHNLAHHIRDTGFCDGIILSDDRRIAGNLLREFPGSRALAPQLDYFPTPDGAPILLIWDSRRQASPPERLRELAHRVAPPGWEDSVTIGHLELPGLRRDPRPSRWAYLIIPPGDRVPHPRPG